MDNEMVRLTVIIVGALLVVYLLKQVMGYEMEGLDENGNGNGNGMEPEEEVVAEENGEIMEEPVDAVKARDPGPMVGAGFDGLSAEELKHACFPTDRELTADDLLPKNEYAAWADVHPHGVGVLQDKNFLHAGHHIGINTVGQSLRNANRSFRSEPPNPQIQVSPWLQTTIGPDQTRRPLEIGSHY